MGFNKKYLPPITEMKKARDSYESDSKFLKDFIGKYDCLIGSKESLDYLNELEEKEKCQKSQNY
jgi:hypothetical protein